MLIDIIAATYHDDRVVEGKEGVTLYFQHPATGEVTGREVDVSNWHALARHPHSITGHHYVRFGAGEHITGEDIPEALSEGHQIAVRIEFREPYPDLELPD